MAVSNASASESLDRAYNLRDANDAKAFYDEWAAAYDRDVSDPSQEYVAPGLVAKAVVDANGNLEGPVFDAGCGTGLSGIALSKIGAKTIDGVDLSEGMLAIAKKTGAYRNLATADLNQPLDQPDDAYDVLVCVGTLTQSHVGPVPALKEFVRVTKSGGIFAATILETLWEGNGFKVEVERLASAGAVNVISTDMAEYRKAAGVKARLLVMRKQ